MFEQFDETGREPRELQKQVLKWLEDNWSSPALCMTLPTGVGKSAILRSIQLQFPGTMGIVPSNALMNQYIATYPDLNYIKGKEHYACKEYAGLSCLEAQELYNSKCEFCIYTENKHRAVDESTIYNPMSLYVHLFKNAKSDIIVVDEAHKLIDACELLVNISFRKSKDLYPNIKTSYDLQVWLNKEVTARRALLKSMRQGTKKIASFYQELTKLERVCEIYTADPQAFFFYTEKQSYYKTTDEYLRIVPLIPPKEVIRRLVGTKKLIVMSATLFQTDIWDLGITNYKYLDMPSPIPKDQRRIIYKPSQIPFNYKSRPADVAKYIKDTMAQYPGQNTIVHVSYSWADKLKSFFPTAYFNTPADKTQILQAFKENGGIWIAAGCAEGIDLPGDECRLTIIPIILKQDTTNPAVQKKLAMSKGKIKYDMASIKQLIQQAGRGTRGEDDFSTTIIGDQSFPSLIMRNKSYLPKSFLEAIVWRSNV